MTVCVSLELSDAHAATEGRRLKRLNGAIRDQSLNGTGLREKAT
jgi:hypothetical protein